MIGTSKRFEIKPAYRSDVSKAEIEAIIREAGIHFAWTSQNHGFMIALDKFGGLPESVLRCISPKIKFIETCSVEIIPYKHSLKSDQITFQLPLLL